ncbi:MAG: Ig-like domain-containing protein, partial [Pseudomonadota bacterium]
IENGALLYTPNQGASGTDSFTYTITANGQQSTATVSVDLLQPIGALSTAAGNAVGTGAGETIVGSHFAQRLKGQAGDDLLLGADGVDTLQGQAGADTLLGGSGDDILRGGSEGDRLDGGSGDDEMTGGGGVDVFVFRAGSGADLVTDYTAGVDLLEVGDYFASKAAALAAVSQSGADAVLTLDGTHQATLAGVQAASLTEDDFVL